MRRNRKEIPALYWLARELKVTRICLARVLGIIRQNRSPYRIVQIDKSDGGKREISIPVKSLKIIQRRIIRFLLRDYNVVKNVYGFSGGNVIDAIKPHLNARVILCLDIKDAFSSVSTERVRDFLLSGREVWLSFGGYKVEKYGLLSWHAAKIVTELTTHRHRLPQGAPTSPRLFDLTCWKLDLRLSRLAKANNGNYTRYADNIFFSVNSGELRVQTLNAVVRATKRFGFVPHKIRIRNLSNAVRMLGLNIINGEIHNTREFKRNLRLSIHHVSWLLGNKGTKILELRKAWRRLQGQMAFARTDTLPQRLLDSYYEVEERVHEKI